MNAWEVYFKNGPLKFKVSELQRVNFTKILFLIMYIPDINLKSKP